MAENVMPIWAQTVAFEGGTPMERATRGAAEFFGMRAYPRNLIFELDREWEDDLSDFNDIPTDPYKIGTKENPISRTTYRQRNAEIDAKLFILGDVTTLRSAGAIREAVDLIRDNDINPDDIRGIKKRNEARAEGDKIKRDELDTLIKRLNLSKTRSTSVPSTGPSRGVLSPEERERLWQDVMEMEKKLAGARSQ